jgi:hypothetical protein
LEAAVAEAAVVDALVGDFGHQLGPQRREAQVLLGVPARLAAGEAAAVGGLVRGGVGPAPPGVGGPVVGDERGELAAQFGPAGHRERRRHPQVVQVALVVVEAEHQRAGAVTVLVLAEPGHHAVGGAQVLDLEL